MKLFYFFLNARRAAIFALIISLFSHSAAACAAEAQKKPFYVRVLVAEKRTYLDLTVKGKYIIRALPSMKPLLQGEGMTRGRLVPTAAGFRMGSREWVCEALMIETQKERDLYLGSTRFRGTASIYKEKNGLMYAVNRLSMEGYLYGVLHHEVAPWWPMEALKAQAIAARTYAYYQALVSQSSVYDLKSSTSSQVYGGSTTERYRTKKAVDKTAGQILLDKDKAFPAYFHATCAGKTAAAKELWKIDVPPLAGGAECGFCRISPHYYWQALVPLSTIEPKLNQNGRAVGRILKIEPVTRTPSNRVGSLKITGTDHETVVAAKDFRVWVGGNLMKSTDFSVKIKDDLAEFHGKGWGHGVGLCQWGALGQALMGKSHKEILDFYYPNSVIGSI